MKILDASLKKIIKKYNFNFIAMTQGELGIKHITSNKLKNFLQEPLSRYLMSLELVILLLQH